MPVLFRRHLSSLALLAALSLGACAAPGGADGGPAMTDAAAVEVWNGSWDGTLADGAVVRIEIRNGRATQYTFRGRQVPILSSGTSGKVMTVYLAGNLAAQLALTLTGPDSMIFDYSSSFGGMASGNLMKRRAAT